MLPVVDRVTPAYEDKIEIFIYRDVNSEAQANHFASQQGIRAIPTMVFVDGKGKEVTRIVGSTSEGDLKSKLDKLIK